MAFAGRATMHPDFPETGIEVARKEIKHLYIRVDRQDGRIRVSAPRRMSDAAIHEAIRRNRSWIERRRQRIATQPKIEAPALETGTCVLVFGEPRRLAIVTGSGHQGVRLREDGVLEMRMHSEGDHGQREALLDTWYRAQLQNRIPELIRTWEPVMGVSVAEWGVRKMRTRWGSCNIRARRIWLNLELVRRPISCLEYVVVHEMVHLLERGHNRRFYMFMDKFLPDWRDARALLNTAPPG
jgi:predicted metal-dependent hydrolase